MYNQVPEHFADLQLQKPDTVKSKKVALAGSGVADSAAAPAPAVFEELAEQVKVEVVELMVFFAVVQIGLTPQVSPTCFHR